MNLRMVETHLAREPESCLGQPIGPESSSLRAHLFLLHWEPHRRLAMTADAYGNGFAPAGFRLLPLPGMHGWSGQGPQYDGSTNSPARLPEPRAADGERSRNGVRSHLPN